MKNPTLHCTFSVNVVVCDTDPELAVTLNACAVGPGFIFELPPPHPLTPAASPSTATVRTANPESHRLRLRHPIPVSRNPGRRIAATTFAPAARDAVAVTATTPAPVAGSIDTELTLQVTAAGAVHEKLNVPR